MSKVSCPSLDLDAAKIGQTVAEIPVSLVKADAVGQDLNDRLCVIHTARLAVVRVPAIAFILRAKIVWHTELGTDVVRSLHSMISRQGNVGEVCSLPSIVESKSCGTQVVLRGCEVAEHSIARGDRHWDRCIDTFVCCGKAGEQRKGSKSIHSGRSGKQRGTGRMSRNTCAYKLVEAAMTTEQTSDAGTG